MRSTGLRFIRSIRSVLIGSLLVAVAAGLLLGIPLLILITIFAATLATLTPPPTAPIIISSPSGTVAVVKQYGPIDEAEHLDIIVVSNGVLTRSFPLVSLPNPTGVQDSDGITIGWNGERQLTIGWPVGGAPVSGPTQAGEVSVSYRAFAPDPFDAQMAATPALILHDAAIRFEERSQEGRGYYVATGKPVSYLNCILEISGTDGVVFGRVAAEVIARGTGGGVGISFRVAPLPGEASPMQTLTQAKIGDSFPRANRYSPRQGNWLLSYRGFTLSEAEDLFSLLRTGRFDLRLATNFGAKIFRYRVDAALSTELIEQFNTCAAKAQIYGRGFSIPLH